MIVLKVDGFEVKVDDPAMAFADQLFWAIRGMESHIAGFWFEPILQVINDWDQMGCPNEDVQAALDKWLDASSALSEALDKWRNR